MEPGHKMSFLSDGEVTPRSNRLSVKKDKGGSISRQDVDGGERHCSSTKKNRIGSDSVLEETKNLSPRSLTLSLQAVQKTVITGSNAIRKKIRSPRTESSVSHASGVSLDQGSSCAISQDLNDVSQLIVTNVLFMKSADKESRKRFPFRQNRNKQK